MDQSALFDPSRTVALFYDPHQFKAELVPLDGKVRSTAVPAASNGDMANLTSGLTRGQKISFGRKTKGMSEAQKRKYFMETYGGNGNVGAQEDKLDLSHLSRGERISFGHLTSGLTMEQKRAVLKQFNGKMSFDEKRKLLASISPTAAAKKPVTGDIEKRYNKSFSKLSGRERKKFLSTIDDGLSLSDKFDKLKHFNHSNSANKMWADLRARNMNTRNKAAKEAAAQKEARRKAKAKTAKPKAKAKTAKRKAKAKTAAPVPAPEAPSPEAPAAA